MLSKPGFSCELYLPSCVWGNDPWCWLRWKRYRVEGHTTPSSNAAHGPNHCASSCWSPHHPAGEGIEPLVTWDKLFQIWIECFHNTTEQKDNLKNKNIPHKYSFLAITKRQLDQNKRKQTRKNNNTFKVEKAEKKVWLQLPQLGISLNQFTISPEPSASLDCTWGRGLCEREKRG